MTKFLSLHQPNGKELKFKADIIIGMMEVEAEGPNGHKSTITVLMTPYNQTACKESIEQVEAMLSENFAL